MSRILERFRKAETVERERRAARIRANVARHFLVMTALAYVDGHVKRGKLRRAAAEYRARVAESEAGLSVQ